MRLLPIGSQRLSGNRLALILNTSNWSRFHSGLLSTTCICCPTHVECKPMPSPQSIPRSGIRPVLALSYEWYDSITGHWKREKDDRRFQHWLLPCVIQSCDTRLSASNATLWRSSAAAAAATTTSTFLTKWTRQFCQKRERRRHQNVSPILSEGAPAEDRTRITARHKCWGQRSSGGNVSLGV